MTTTNIAYSSNNAVTASNWESLAADSWATLPAVSNTSNLYVDILIGGQIDLDTTTGTLAAGESFDIYVSALWSTATASSYTGGIDTSFTANDATLTEDTEFNPHNLILIAKVQVEDTLPDVSQGYNWGPIGIAQFFGGNLPQSIILVGHNNTGGTTTAATSTTAVNYVGITYTNA